MRFAEFSLTLAGLRLNAAKRQPVGIASPPWRHNEKRRGTAGPNADLDSDYADVRGFTPRAATPPMAAYGLSFFCSKTSGRMGFRTSFNVTPGSWRDLRAEQRPGGSEWIGGILSPSSEGAQPTRAGSPAATTDGFGYVGIGRISRIDPEPVYRGSATSRVLVVDCLRKQMPPGAAHQEREDPYGVVGRFNAHGANP